MSKFSHINKNYMSGTNFVVFLSIDHIQNKRGGLREKCLPGFLCGFYNEHNISAYENLWFLVTLNERN